MTRWLPGPLIRGSLSCDPGQSQQRCLRCHWFICLSWLWMGCQAGSFYTQVEPHHRKLLKGNSSKSKGSILLILGRSPIGKQLIRKSGHISPLRKLNVSVYAIKGLPQWLSNTESASNAGDAGWIPGPGRSPGGRHGRPLQYPCLENSTDRGTWWATVHWVARTQTQLKLLIMHTRMLWKSTKWKFTLMKTVELENEFFYYLMIR